MVLRFKLDENLPQRAEQALRGLGHDVETALSEGLSGAEDPRLLSACIAEDRILVTLDLDFADIRVYPPGSHRGVWVLRPAQQSFDVVVQLVVAGVRLAAVERTSGQLWVIDERRVRIRDR
jgi:predicted nuclease of predicted toxin-antitoxin system